MSALARLIATLVKPWPSLAVWIVLVFVASSVPMPESPPIDFPLAPDKIGHCLAYALLAALAVRAVWRPWRPWWVVVAAALGVTAYGAVMEVWQLVLAGRSCDLSDGIANAVGAAIGTGLTVGAYVERRARTSRGKGPAGHDEGQRRETD